MNERIYLADRYLALSGIFKRQSAMDAPLANADIDTRHKCDITRQNEITRKDILDCAGVDLDDQITKSRLSRFTFNYTSGVTPQIIAGWASLFFGAAAAPTGTPANEVQTLTRSGTITNGTFTLAIDFEGRQGVTAAIPFAATAAQIQAALVKTGQSITKLIRSGDVVVSGDWTAGIVLTFGGRLRRANLPLLTVGNAGLTGGTVVNTATANGDQNLHPITRSTSRTKVKTSFIIGDINGGVSAKKYYNAVVESITPTISLRDEVGFTVTVLCNSEPSIETGVTIPDCINTKPLEAEDCRIKLGTLWETLDIFSQTLNLSDAIPVGKETFGFDGLDPSDFIRGRNPKYSFPTQIFGSENDTLAALIDGVAPVEIDLGQPGNRVSFLAGNARLLPEPDPNPYIGEEGRQAFAFDIIPYRDGNNVPVRAEFRGDQTSAFLTV